MRVLEVTGITTHLLYGAHLLLQSTGYDSAFGFLIFIAILIVGCHCWVEGWRWQMAPAYFSTLLIALYEYANVFWDYQAPWMVGGAIVLCALAAFAACLVMPVFKLPVPTGPYEIGTQTRSIVDGSRRDPFSDDPTARRELVIQIWYPANPVHGKARMSPYRDKRITTLKSAHFALVATHSMLDAQLHPSIRGFPLLFYTPSWSGIRTECTIQIEELASHGYVVVAIDHPYSSRIVAFPDGRIAHRKFSGEENYSSDEAVEAFVRVADEQIRLRADDARSVLDALESLNRTDPRCLLTGALSLDRVGIFGFSLGGGTAAQVCAVDSRFKAGLNMGGMIAGEVPSRGTIAPFFFMFEGIYAAWPYVGDVDVSGLAPIKRREVEFARRQFEWMKESLKRFGGYWLTIDGTTHADFSDSPHFSPLRSGSFKPNDISRILGGYVRTFFDERLKAAEGPLLDNSPPGAIPKVQVQRWSEAAARRLDRTHQHQCP